MPEEKHALKNPFIKKSRSIICHHPLKRIGRFAYLKVLGIKELEAVLTLHTLVLNTLPDLSLYFPYTRQEMKDYLHQQRGFVLGLYDKEKLVAFRVTTWPGVDQENLGHHLSLSTNQLLRVIQLEGTNVHPFYRGNHLQQLLTEKSIEFLDLPAGEFILLTAISPYNRKSLLNMMSWGMKVVGLKECHSSMVRLILRKGTPAELDATPLQWKNCQWIRATDIQSQQQCLKENYQGIHIKSIANHDMQICYGQPKSTVR